MYSTWQCNDPDRPRQVSRSKAGCSTCKRRKVRCDEIKPKCGHCRRLRRDCVWPTTRRRNNSARREAAEPSSAVPTHETGPSQEYDPQSSDLQLVVAGENDGDQTANRELVFDEVFNYASFLWDDSTLPTISPEAWQSADLSLNNIANGFPDVSQPSNGGGLPDMQPDEEQLVSWFLMSEVPPILAPVETRFRWDAIRRHLLTMAATSQALRYAILAFAALQLEHAGTRRPGGHSALYEKSVAYFASQDQLLSDVELLQGQNLQCVLATLFLLSYIDLVTDRVEFAHAHLRTAYEVFQKVDLSGLNVHEKRLLSWIRLLDARAVSAGGEGLFLKADEEIANLDLSSPHGNNNLVDGDVEDMLFDIIIEPALRFYHKVQSFMGRISKIDPWHRSRGTVDDETEVMALAASIRKDIKNLYAERPQLMDLTVAGSLTEPYLSPSLSKNITRSLRTYLANYYAAYIHLQRVAYKHLPRTVEVVSAITTIREMAKLMTTDEAPDQPLPVNMLWPLLMWGCEEDSLNEREWILASIRRMQSKTTNARVTAEVLEEVQRRQDSQGRRIDVRSVMEDVFNACFAIV